MLQLLLGQIPEAIYFALFMIYTKNLKQKRILYIILMISEYLILKLFFKFNIYFQLSYTIFTYLILKLLYKNKAQIIDVFTFTISSIILIVISAFSYTIISATIGIKLVAYIIKNILMFVFLFIARKRLNKIQKLYKKLWNRNDKVDKKIKTTTFRSINAILFNVMFWVINFGMIYAITFYGRR